MDRKIKEELTKRIKNNMIYFMTNKQFQSGDTLVNKNALLIISGFQLEDMTKNVVELFYFNVVYHELTDANVEGLIHISNEKLIEYIKDEVVTPYKTHRIKEKEQDLIDMIGVNLEEEDNLIE